MQATACFEWLLFCYCAVVSCETSKKKNEKKLSSACEREREGGVSLSWVLEVQTGEFASLECENRGHWLFSNTGNMRWVCNALT